MAPPVPAPGDGQLQQPLQPSASLLIYEKNLVKTAHHFQVLRLTPREFSLLSHLLNQSQPARRHTSERIIAEGASIRSLSLQIKLCIGQNTQISLVKLYFQLRQFCFYYFAPSIQHIVGILKKYLLRRGSACVSVHIVGKEGSLMTQKFEYHSRMECDLIETSILESLEDLGYKGPLLKDGALSQAASAGAGSPKFTKLCAWLVSELRVFYKLEEKCASN